MMVTKKVLSEVKVGLVVVDVNIAVPPDTDEATMRKLEEVLDDNEEMEDRVYLAVQEAMKEAETDIKISGDFSIRVEFNAKAKELR
jgi:hypothetical protein